MISIQDLYNRTNGGLDILAIHFPEVVHSSETGEAFRMRAGERTASAHVKRVGDVWKVTDFGGEGRMIDPLDVHKLETGLDTADAIKDLAARFNIEGGKFMQSRAVAPDIEREPAMPEQKEGDCWWDISQDFTPEDLKIMGGERCTAEHLVSLNWYRVNYIASVKNRTVTYKRSNEHYPIFLRECWFTDDGTGEQKAFYKIYEPLNADKGYRFQYRPAGLKPPRYINGLFELKRRRKQWNDEESAKADNAGENYIEQKYPEAIICSGERDAICARGLGYWPLWFNSETYNVSDSEWFQISQVVDTVYNIPDLDTTGRRRGAELALKFIDIKTIWLPDALMKFRDRRGNPCKDLRDFCEHYKKRRDFENLRTQATAARFWNIVAADSSDKGKKSKPRLRAEIDPYSLSQFLLLNGFCSLMNTINKERKLVRIVGSVVEEVTTDQVRDFVDSWAKETGQPVMVLNALLRTQYLNDASLRRLPAVDLDFSTATRKSQFFFFNRNAYEVTAEDIKIHDLYRGDLKRYVWKDNIVDCSPKIADEMFSITCTGEPTLSEDYDIEIKNTRSKYFSYLINSSRIYWRKELEDNLQERPNAEEYRRAHKFDIAGEGLTYAEIQEQKQCLISKIFCIGYLLHRHKEMSRAWAPFAMDNLIGEIGQCNGRSGKSFMFVGLKKFIETLTISGRNIKEVGRFSFQEVKRTTDMIIFDDCHEYFPFKSFYDIITADMKVEPKQMTSYTLPFHESPKIVFTTNYVPKEFDPSSKDRFLYLVFSDYYHKKGVDNNYLENRSIRDDFPGLDADLMSREYPAADLEADANFFMQCVRFYLSVSRVSLKFEPDLKNIIYRKTMNEMTDNFREWAEGYFSEDGDKLDTFIVRQDAFEAYKQFSNIRHITMNRFSISLRAFVQLCEWTHELNPKEFLNSAGRIIQRVSDPHIPNTTKSYEMIYVRSVKERERMKQQPPSGSSAMQQELQF